jgi:tetratricopeptide (TPR) repeat protein
MNGHFAFFVNRRLTGLLIVLSIVVFLGCSSSRGVRQGPKRDENLVRTNRAAEIAFKNDKFSQAASLYRQALKQAYIRDDLSAVVDAQYNLAVCQLKMDDCERALERVHLAAGEAAAGDRVTGADILLLEATILYRLGKLNQAHQVTDEILLLNQRPSAQVEAKTHFLRGVLADRRGDIDRLRTELEALNRMTGPGMAADREELTGRLAMAENRWHDAAGAFDRAAAQRRQDLDYRQMAENLALAARASEQAGKRLAAAKRYLRAGRSALLRGKNRQAQKWLNQASGLAGQAGDEFVVQQTHFYLKQIEHP